MFAQLLIAKKAFLKDNWTRPDGNGSGLTCVLQDGNFFEKAGVNTTKLTVPLSKQLAQQIIERGKLFSEKEIENLYLYANGISLVIHPINPYIPTVHANYRYVEVFNKKSGEIVDFWFGGGGDLTPHYLFEQDCQTFHQLLKEACEVVSQQLYTKLKIDCDKYFYITHRKEHRGIGGIFFDDFIVNNSWEQTFKFVEKAGIATLNAYKIIVTRRKDTEYNEQNMLWKKIRRGRYVEFNLVYDRGTKFGFNTPDARIESILMSLPLDARWEYQFQIKEGSDEDKMQDVIKNPRNWA